VERTQTNSCERVLRMSLKEVHGKAPLHPPRHFPRTSTQMVLALFQRSVRREDAHIDEKYTSEAVFEANPQDCSYYGGACRSCAVSWRDMRMLAGINLIRQIGTSMSNMIRYNSKRDEKRKKQLHPALTYRDLRGTELAGQGSSDSRQSMKPVSLLPRQQHPCAAVFKACRGASRQNISLRLHQIDQRHRPSGL